MTTKEILAKSAADSIRQLTILARSQAVLIAKLQKDLRGAEREIGWNKSEIAAYRNYLVEPLRLILDLPQGFHYAELTEKVRRLKESSNAS